MGLFSGTASLHQVLKTALLAEIGVDRVEKRQTRVPLSRRARGPVQKVNKFLGRRGAELSHGVVGHPLRLESFPFGIDHLPLRCVEEEIPQLLVTVHETMRGVDFGLNNAYLGVEQRAERDFGTEPL